jgi:hypothetical protein
MGPVWDLALRTSGTAGAQGMAGRSHQRRQLLEKQHHTTSFSFEQTPHRGLTNPGVCKLMLP